MVGWAYHMDRLDHYLPLQKEKKTHIGVNYPFVYHWSLNEATALKSTTIFGGIKSKFQVTVFLMK